MAANDEYSGEFRGLSDEGGDGDGVLPQRGLGLEEILRGGVISAEFDAGRIEGCFAATRGGHGQVGDGGQNVVGVRELGLRGLFSTQLSLGDWGRTRNQPEGFPVEPSCAWEVRMKRTLGLVDMVIDFVDA